MYNDSLDERFQKQMYESALRDWLDQDLQSAALQRAVRQALASLCAIGAAVVVVHRIGLLQEGDHMHGNGPATTGFPRSRGRCSTLRTGWLAVAVVRGEEFCVLARMH